MTEMVGRAEGCKVDGAAGPFGCVLALQLSRWTASCATSYILNYVGIEHILAREKDVSIFWNQLFYALRALSCANTILIRCNLLASRSLSFLFFAHSRSSEIKLFKTNTGNERMLLKQNTRLTNPSIYFTNMTFDTTLKTNFVFSDVHIRT